jgi:hypothetical protein
MMIRHVIVATLIATLPATGLQAQGGSPINDMLLQARDALNNLNYQKARETVHDVLTLGPRLKHAQELLACEIAAAAFYPEDSSARRPDSALVYLARVARFRPTGSLPTEITWSGLDSLLRVARQQIFGASAQPALQTTLTGVDPRPVFDVATSRPARWQLILVPADDSPPVVVDTLGLSTSGRLSMRAHTGREVVLHPGDHELRAMAVTADRGDTIVLRFTATATGAPPMLVDLPTLETTKILPERASRAIAPGIFSGPVIGGATWAIAHYARAPKPLGAGTADSRATQIGVVVGLGSIVAGFLDPGRPLPDNIRANAQLRADYNKRMAEAVDENRKRVREFKMVLAIDSEAR